MSRLSSPSPMGGRAQNNIYTALAFISFVASFAVLVYVVLRFYELGIL